MDVTRLHGICTPILTPLTPDEHVDEASLRRLVDFQIEHGVHGLWALGTTGEFPCLLEEDRARAIHAVMDQVRGRVPVVANVGDSSTQLALRHARHAVDAGADMLALTPPHYFLNTMDELLGHYRTMKQAFPDKPLIIYNIPPTVKANLTLPTIMELAREGTATGIKDTQNDVQFLRTMVLEMRRAGLGDSFRVMFGTRMLIDAGMAVGTHGAIPATANIAPSATVACYEAAVRGDFTAAAAAQERALQYEDLARLARGGSAMAATIGSMKETLKEWGILEHTTATRPLRPLAETEIEALRERLKGLAVGGRVPIEAVAG